MFFRHGARKVGLEEASSSSPGETRDANHAGNLMSPTRPSSSVVLSVFVWVFHALWRGGERRTLLFHSALTFPAAPNESLETDGRRRRQTDAASNRFSARKFSFFSTVFGGIFSVFRNTSYSLCAGTNKCAYCGEC